MHTNKQKLDLLHFKLKDYERRLADAMIGYRGVRHESAVSEIKHDKVMVLKAIIAEIKEEIYKLQITPSPH